MDKQAFIAAVKAAGIVGEGGAGFPAHVKYAADADTVIANGCECEPLLHTDQHHMLHHANEIVRAFSELMQATGAKRGVIALKKKYKEATKILTDAIGNRPIELALLPNFYPAGDEQTLVREVTGRSVPPLGLPLMVGAVVANVGTLVSVAHALDGKPVTHKFLTVTGEVKKPGIVCVPIGTPLSACLEAAGGPTVSDPVFVLGGPMMGLIATNLEAPNIKGTAGILFFTDKEDRSVENPTCIHCGKCLTVCPMKLEPLYMYKYYQKRDFENMQKYHILDCFACGSCSYNCPGRLPLTHTFKTAKLLFAARAAEEKARAEAAAKEAETK